MASTPTVISRGMQPIVLSLSLSLSLSLCCGSFRHLPNGGSQGGWPVIRLLEEGGQSWGGVTFPSMLVFPTGRERINRKKDTFYFSFLFLFLKKNGKKRRGRNGNLCTTFGHHHREETTETDRCTHLSLKEREEGFFLGEEHQLFPLFLLLFLFAAAKTALVQWYCTDKQGRYTRSPRNAR